MPRYTVTLTGTTDYTIDVDADHPGRAIELAAEHAPTLCHRCAAPRTGPHLSLGDEWRAVAVYDDAGTDLTEET